MNNQPLQKVTKSLYIVTDLGKLPFMPITEMARTWAIKEDSVNTSIIHLYSTTIRSTTEAMASARSDPLIFIPLPPIHVRFTKYVALLHACVENKAGPPGPWTKKQVRKGRERDALAHAQTQKHAGTQPGNTANAIHLRDRVYEH